MHDCFRKCLGNASPGREGRGAGESEKGGARQGRHHKSTILGALNISVTFFC